MGEFELTKQIREYLTSAGIFVWRDRQHVSKPRRGSSKSANGVADILGILPPTGRLLAIEVKVKGNVQSLDQKRFQFHIEKNGGFYLLAYSLDDVIAKLKDGFK